jgi:hypothetical protein
MSSKEVTQALNRAASMLYSAMQATMDAAGFSAGAQWSKVEMRIEDAQWYIEQARRLLETAIVALNRMR